MNNFPHRHTTNSIGGLPATWPTLTNPSDLIWLFSYFSIHAFINAFLLLWPHCVICGSTHDWEQPVVWSESVWIFALSNLKQPAECSPELHRGCRAGWLLTFCGIHSISSVFISHGATGLVETKVKDGTDIILNLQCNAAKLVAVTKEIYPH